MRKPVLGLRVLWWIVRDLVTRPATPVLLLSAPALQSSWRTRPTSLPAYVEADRHVGILLEELDPDSPLPLRQVGDPPHQREPPRPEWGHAGVEEKRRRIMALAESLRMMPDRAAVLELLQNGTDGDLLRLATGDVVSEVPLERCQVVDHVAGGFLGAGGEP